MLNGLRSIKQPLKVFDFKEIICWVGSLKCGLNVFLIMAANVKKMFGSNLIASYLMFPHFLLIYASAMVMEIFSVRF